MWAAIATSIGLPATAVPIPHEGELPIGVQIIGGYLEDRTTIAFAGLIERNLTVLSRRRLSETKERGPVCGGDKNRGK